MATETQDAGHAAAKTSVGMPQLDFSTFPNQIFWLVVTLVLIYVILSRVALPRIGGILANRESTRANDIAAAEDLKSSAAEAEEAYNKALDDARAEAHRIIGETRAEIQAELDAAIAKADAEIAEKAAESEKAIAEIRAGALESVREVAEATTSELIVAMGGAADDAAITAAITDQMKG